MVRLAVRSLLIFIASYFLLLWCLQSFATAPAVGPPQDISVAALMMMPAEAQDAHLFILTGRVAGRWNVGGIAGIALRDDSGAEITVLVPDDDPLPALGQTVRVRVRPRLLAHVASFSVPPLYLKTETPWQIIS